MFENWTTLRPHKSQYELFNYAGRFASVVAGRQCLAGSQVIIDRQGRTTRIDQHPDSWRTGNKDILKIKVNGGFELRCTDNHPVMTDRGWIEAGKLTVGDKVVVCDGFDKWESGDD